MNTRITSPLVGFNNNVRYRGIRFHIQTEDSGVARPHIITHLFADGGRVIKTLRADYSEHVDHPDYRTTVQRMMRDQHKAMAHDLRKGAVDPIIDALMLLPSDDILGGPLLSAGHLSSDAAPDSERLSPESAGVPPSAPAGAPATDPVSAPVAGATSASSAVDTGGASLDPESVPPPAKESVAPRVRPSRSGVFTAVPSDSLDEMILHYVAGRPR